MGNKAFGGLRSWESESAFELLGEDMQLSDVQGLGKPPGFKGKGQEGKGQGKDFMTLRKPLPLWRVRGFVKDQGVSRDFYSSNYKVL